MNFDIDAHTILKVRHGSHAYGLATETSDIDVKGICIEPLEYHLGFSKRFENHIEEASKGYEFDLVIYSLKKFANLASDSNPNIIEVLFSDDEDVLFSDSFGEELRAFRDNFISKRARYSFAGFAHSQLKRIKSHRSWLLNPPKQPPSRKEFGLSETLKISKSQFGAFETILNEGSFVELSNEALVLYSRERAYKQMMTQWQQYENWKKTRNPKRAELEAKYGYDVKHAQHLIRLMRMCKEILSLGRVIVKRQHDKDELMAIRNGYRSYEEILEEAENLEKICANLYETSSIPHTPDINKIDAFIVNLTQKYLGLLS